MTKQQKAQDESRTFLLNYLKPGDTVYGLVRHVSQSGMSRDISLFVMKDNELLGISYDAATLLDWPMAKKPYNAIRVQGCGMDMVFHTIYCLSWALFKDSFTCIGNQCPSNDHSNGDRDYSPHNHSDSGYALKYRHI